MEVRTAGDAAKALVSALGMRFGEINIRVNEGQISLVRHGTSLKLDDLDGYFVPEPGLTRLQESPSEGVEL